ncbi:MAG: hypothetical protein M1594_00360 [Candidatus Marsarchaeota archaeon]|nr:hypothetical protein [Candidatus Marsarchaeota archaeon]
MNWKMNWKKLKLKLADRKVILVIALVDLVLFATLTFILEEHYSFYNAVYNTLCDLTFAHCDNGYGVLTKISSLTTIIGTWGALAFIATMALQAFMEGGKKRMESEIMKNEGPLHHSGVRVSWKNSRRGVSKPGCFIRCNRLKP